MGIFEKNREAVLSQETEELLHDYYYASREVEKLNNMDDYADYVNEDWWREIQAAIVWEILRRCDKEV